MRHPKWLRSQGRLFHLFCTLSSRVQAGKRAKHLSGTSHIGQSSWSKFLSQLYDHYLGLFCSPSSLGLFARVCLPGFVPISFPREFFPGFLFQGLLFFFTTWPSKRGQEGERHPKSGSRAWFLFCMLVLRANLTKSHDCLSSFYSLLSSLFLVFLPQSRFSFSFFSSFFFMFLFTLSDQSC